MSTPTINSGSNIGAQTSNSTTYSVSRPASAEGDVVYIALVTDGASADLTSPDLTAIYSDVDIGGTATFVLFRREVGASEPDTYTVTTTVSERAVWVAWAVNNDGGIDAQATNATGTGTTATVNAVTTTVDSCLVIAVVGTDLVATPMGALTNHTQLDQVSTSSGGSVGVYYRTADTAGESLGGTVSLAASEEWLGLRFAIEPAGFVPPVAPGSTPTAAAIQRIRTYLPA